MLALYSPPGDSSRRINGNVAKKDKERKREKEKKRNGIAAPLGQSAIRTKIAAREDGEEGRGARERRLARLILRLIKR